MNFLQSLEDKEKQEQLHQELVSLKKQLSNRKELALRQELYERRIKGHDPLIVPIVSDNEPFSWLYIGGTPSSINNGNLKQVGWAGQNWKTTEGQYKAAKRQKGAPDEKFKMLIVFKIPKSQIIDKDIQKIIEKRGYKRIQEFYNDDELATEFFHNCPIIQSIDAVFEFYGISTENRKRMFGAAFYPYQKEDAEKISSLILSTEFKLINYFYVSPTRSGKSFVVGLALKNICNYVGAKNYAIITPHPDGYTSYDKFFNKHIDASMFKCFNLTGLDLETIRREAIENLKNGINNIFFFSWAKLKTFKDKRFNKTINFLIEMGVFGAIVDEYHREADTVNSEDVIKLLKPTFVLGVSATPYTEFMLGIANVTNTIIRWEESIKAYKSEYNVPDYNQSLFFKDLLETAKEYLRSEGNFNEGEEFTWDKLFEVITTDNKIKLFRYEKAILFMLNEYLSDPAQVQGIHDNWLCNILEEKTDANYKNVLQNILCFVPTSDAAFVLANLINNRYSSYKAICWTSNYGRNKQNKVLGLSKKFKSTERKLTRWHEMQNNNENKDNRTKTIIVTCQSLTTAVTLPALSAIILLKNVSSVELFMQMIGRPNNSGKDFNEVDDNGIWIKRQTAAIVPKGVFLQIVAKMSPVAAAMDEHKHEKFDKVIRKMLRNMNIFSFDNAIWNSITSQDLINEISQYATVSNVISFDRSGVNRVNLFSISDDAKRKYYEDLNFYPITSAGKRGTTIIGDTGNDGKTFEKRQRENKEKAKKMSREDLNKSLIARIENLFDRIPFFVVIKNINNIDDFINCSDDDFRKLLKVSKECVINLFNDKIICKNIWNYKLKFNSNITDINLHKSGFEGMAARYFQLHNMNISEIAENVIIDPLSLVSDVLSKELLIKKIKKSKNILIWEKTGTWVYFLIKELGINILKNLTLYTFDPLCEEIITYILGEDAKLVTLKYIKDINILYNMKQRYDVIISNPPYQGKKAESNKGSGSGNAIWQDFVELCYNILDENGYMCFIHPIDWRLGKTSKKKEAAQNIILNNQIHYAKLFIKPFTASQVVDWYILEKTPKYKDTVIDFDNGKYNYFITDEVIPNHGGPIVDSILSKVFKTTNNNLVPATTWWYDPDEGKNKTYKYVHGTNYTRNEYKYYDTPHKDQFKQKVLTCDTRPFRPIYDKGELGIAGHIHYILVNNEDEANFLISVVNSELMLFLSLIFSTDEIRGDGLSARWQCLYPTTRIKIDSVKLNNNDDVYAYFGIIPGTDEYNYIKSYLKSIGKNND